MQLDFLFEDRSLSHTIALRFLAIYNDQNPDHVALMHYLKNAVLPSISTLNLNKYSNTKSLAFILINTDFFKSSNTVCEALTKIYNEDGEAAIKKIIQAKPQLYKKAIKSSPYILRSAVTTNMLQICESYATSEKYKITVDKLFSVLSNSKKPVTFYKSHSASLTKQDNTLLFNKLLLRALNTSYRISDTYFFDSIEKYHKAGFFFDSKNASTLQHLQNFPDFIKNNPQLLPPKSNPQNYINTVNNYKELFPLIFNNSDKVFDLSPFISLIDFHSLHSSNYSSNISSENLIDFINYLVSFNLANPTRIIQLSFKEIKNHYSDYGKDVFKKGTLPFLIDLLSIDFTAPRDNSLTINNAVFLAEKLDCPELITKMIEKGFYFSKKAQNSLSKGNMHLLVHSIQLAEQAKKDIKKSKKTKIPE